MALETIGLQPISIDVYKKHKQTTIYANEADVNGRGLLVTLVNNGTPIDSTGVTLRMGFLNNVNEQKIYDFTLVDALTGKYSIYYPTELLDQSGGSVKQVEIKAYEGENVITFLPLYLYVNDAVVTNEGLESTNEGSALLKALNEYEGVNNAYILAEQNRDSEYSAAEASRGASYTIVEANRDSLYNVAEAERDSDYDLAEASRDGLYNTAESARGVQYSNAESARNSQYSTAESARDGLYHTAESNRDALLNSVNAQLNEKVQNFKIKNDIINGDFNNGSTVGWNGVEGSLSIENNELVLTSNKDSGTIFHIATGWSANTGEKIYFRYKITPFRTHTPSVWIGSLLYMDKIASAGVKTTVSQVATMPSNGAGIAIYGNSAIASGNVIGAKVYFDEVMVINLSKVFGSGNEPTKLEMDELMKVIPNGWWDGELTLTQKQFITWQLNLIRKNTNAIIALGGTII